jgi:NAD+ synthase (glutamine-hydrolysing)
VRVRLALAQINPTVGDIAGNARLIEEFAGRAQEAGADLVVFPELALTGYPPKDLLLQEGFVAGAERMAGELLARARGSMSIVFGTPMAVPGGASGVSNALVAGGPVLRAGVRYAKRLLPTYDVFDEDRYFVPGTRPVIIPVPGPAGHTTRVGLSICEDLWRGEDVGFSHRYENAPDPVAELVHPPLPMDATRGAEIIINPSASPFVLGKGSRHRALLRRHAVANRVYVAGVNQVGGNDELVFDGHAAVFGPDGALFAAAPGFVEHLLVVDVPQRGSATPVTPVPDVLLDAPEERLLFEALVLGTRDYCRKTGFAKAVLGLSGGIDSAVTAVIAAAALGSENVLGVAMPSRYSSPGSLSDAAELAMRLACDFRKIPIEGPFGAFTEALAPVFGGLASDVTEENLQSRVRGTLLMALSNKQGRLLLTTGNKSELGVGYCTLYGDMNGGLAVLSDVSKQWVYRLARWMNDHPAQLGQRLRLSTPPIPEESITKPPSAELRPDQTDQDTLPPYDQLDEVLERYVERRQSPAHIAAETGFDPGMINRIVRMTDLAEFKRKQAAIGLKVTGVAFGSGRRFPIAQGYRPVV